MSDPDHEIRGGGGGLSSRCLEKETGGGGGGGGGLQKNFFGLFMPQFGPKVRGGGASPGPIS